MEVQRAISAERMRSFVGQRVEVLLDAELEPDYWLARASDSAPDIDGKVYVHGKNLQAGQFLFCRITSADDYELAGEAE